MQVYGFSSMEDLIEHFKLDPMVFPFHLWNLNYEIAQIAYMLDTQLVLRFSNLMTDVKETIALMSIDAALEAVSNWGVIKD